MSARNTEGRAEGLATDNDKRKENARTGNGHKQEKTKIPGNIGRVV